MKEIEYIYTYIFNAIDLYFVSILIFNTQFKKFLTEIFIFLLFEVYSF